MPNILFASNSISHFPGTIVGGEAWSYDANRVPYSIEVPIATVASSPLLEESQTDETWFHFRMGDSYWDDNRNEKICEIVDIDGNHILSMAYRNRSSHGYYASFTMDGSNYGDVRYIPILSNNLRTYDIQIKTTALEATFRIYVNELLIIERSFAIGSFVKPRFLWIGGKWGSGGAGRGGRFSEILVADGDTRNARVDLLRPVAAGAYTNWLGPLASLADDDPTTGLTTTQADQNQTTTLTPYTGANNISNIVQVTTSVRGINSPTKLQHLIRMSNVDYLTPDFNLPFEKDHQVTDWRLNPATSQPWEANDIVGAEFGFRSIA